MSHIHNMYNEVYVQYVHWCTYVRICTVHVCICETRSKQHMTLAVSSPEKLALLRPPEAGSGCQLCKQRSCHSNLDIAISLWQPLER